MGLLFVIILSLVAFRGYRNKRRANTLLKIQKNKIEKTPENLKSTQAQLIQSEKMASLGELTTGIAHEIQNPLNFVNNFSDVNTELIDELRQAADRENFEEVKEIANDRKKNEEKINHHRRRADAIVKGMLQYSLKIFIGETKHIEYSLFLLSRLKQIDRIAMRLPEPYNAAKSFFLHQ